MRALALSVVAFVLVACGGSKEPPNSVDVHDIADADHASTPPTAATPAAAAPTQEPPAKKRKPYEIINLCPRPATIIFGEDAKAGMPGRTLSGNDKIEDAPRDKDGNQVIHLLVRGEPLVKVHVSRGTKRVEIGTSCDTLEMH